MREGLERKVFALSPAGEMKHPASGSVHAEQRIQEFSAQASRVFEVPTWETDVLSLVNPAEQTMLVLSIGQEWGLFDTEFNLEQSLAHRQTQLQLQAQEREIRSALPAGARVSS